MNNIKKFKLNEVYGIDNPEKDSSDVLTDITGKGGSPVVDICSSSDGKYIASVDGRIHLWEYQSGRKIRSFYSATRLTSICFSSDNKFIISGNVNGELQSWDINTGKIQKNYLKS